MVIRMSQNIVAMKNADTMVSSSTKPIMTTTATATVTSPQTCLNLRRTCLKRRSDLNTKAEFRRLKTILPSIQTKENVSRLDIILEAIKYIDDLQDQLVDRLGKVNKEDDMEDAGNTVVRGVFSDESDFFEDCSTSEEEEEDDEDEGDMDLGENKEVTSDLECEPEVLAESPL